MSIVTYINRKIQEIQIDNWEPVEWKPINEKWVELFEDKNTEEGKLSTAPRLTICNLKSQKDDFVSNLIGRFQGGISHTVYLLYNPRILFYLDDQGIYFLESALSFFYKNPPNIKDIPIYVWGSADTTGLNFFDFSHYNDRKKYIYDLPFLSDVESRSIVYRSISSALTPYDHTGLFFWLLYKYVSKMFLCFDDSKSPFCSEFVYDTLRNVSGYLCADQNNPSPYMIHKKMKKHIIYHPLEGKPEDRI